MTTTTANVIYIGNFSSGLPDIDPNGTGSAENANALVSMTFDKTDMKMEQLTYHDGNSDGFVPFDGATGAGGEYVSYDLGGGTTAEPIDQAVWYDVTLTLSGGGTMNTSVMVIQTPSGETFVNEFSASLDGLTITDLQFTGVNNNLFGQTHTSRSIDGTVVCFAAGTLVRCPGGERPVEDLRPGDDVLSQSGAAQRILSMIHTPDGGFGANAPICFAPGAIGPGMPNRELRISPQHRVLCASQLVERMFSVPEVWLPAKRFLDLPGVTQDQGQPPVSYYHIELARHDVLIAEGAPVESCLIGEQARKALPKSALKLFPATASPCRPVPDGHKQRNFVVRLKKNCKPINDGNRLSLTPA